MQIRRLREAPVLERRGAARKAEQKLEMLLLQGLDSGGPVEANREHWEWKRQRLERGRSQRPAGQSR